MGLQMYKGASESGWWNTINICVLGVLNFEIAVLGIIWLTLKSKRLNGKKGCVQQKLQV